MTRKEMLEKMDNFQLAIFAMIEDNGFLEASCQDKMTADQEERFRQIKTIYLEECLKDCPF